MKEYNVLILSSGRRVELLQCFKIASKKLNIKSKIITADSSQLAPTHFFADDYFIVPRVEDDEYIQSLIDIILDKEVAIVIPTTDIELLKLSKNKNKIESLTNAKVLVSDATLIESFNNKKTAMQIINELGLDTPKTYTLNEINDGKVTFPVFIKPIRGSSSINTFKVNNYEELNVYKSIIKDYILQNYVCGDEYTIDVFLDLESIPITIVPRKRISTRSGEINKGKIEKNKEIIDAVNKLLKNLNFIGPITLQLIKNDNLNFIEINPRFGGGAPMSIKAGADSCENIYRLLLGEKLQYNENYVDELYFLRYDSSISFKKDNLL